MTLETPRPPCPFCGELCIVLVRPRGGRFGKTCGKQGCRRKAQGFGEAHFRRMRQAVGAAAPGVLGYQLAMAAHVR